MCIARVGKVVSMDGGKAEVEFFDGRSLDRVDVSMVGASKGSYVEVFGNLALSQLTPGEARRRRSAWTEIRRAAAAP
ncbi:MAG TPA: HypC/HybG/HupF family hydrogenase formation chaperone [Nitrososphaerales archaeon]|nr:HypC/HybG/HupF family hydrogenase formation chaperone [Nitrososphaerales archaeon]